MKKKLLAFLVSAAVAGSLSACGGEQTKTAENAAAGTPVNTEAGTLADTASATKGPASDGTGNTLKEASAKTKDGPYDIAVIIKATSSDYWQYLLVGAENYAKEHPDLVKVTTYGPPSESDIDEQVAILEDVISRGPDAIIIASTSSDATVPQIEDAVAKGIPVITIDNKINTDQYTSFIATNQKEAAGEGAGFMIDYLKKQYGDLTGKTIGVVSSIAGVQVMEERDNGFIDKVKEIAPEVNVLEPQYCDNDMTKAMTIVENMITANPELIGLYGGNNITGSGISRVISQRSLDDQICVVAFDSDAEEVEGLGSGSVKGLVVQDPYGMGYDGVDFAVKALRGQKVEKDVGSPVTIVTKDNMNSDAIKGLLDPYTKKK